MYCIKELMKPKFLNHLMHGIKRLLLSASLHFTPNLKTDHLFWSCQLKHNVPKVNQPAKTHQDQEGALTLDVYKNSQVWSDHYVLNTPGRLLTSYRWKNPTIDFMVVQFLWCFYWTDLGYNQVLHGETLIAKDAWTMIMEFGYCWNFPLL